MDLGEIPFEHDLQNQLSIPTIIFLSPVCPTPNLGSMPHPYRVTKFFEHRFKPGAVPAGFQPYDHLAGELGVEVPYIVLAMVQLSQLNLSIGRVTVSYRLHPSVEIHAAIYCSRHRRLPQRSTVRRAPESLSKTRAAGGAWFITSLLTKWVCTSHEVGMQHQARFVVGVNITYPLLTKWVCRARRALL